ncbi:MAG: lytic transglycosylase domain-containing protein, partial [Altererythrobacter sp.]|nr:lytic transglycosylase domain-containing protein [Altererythrobacter sp.]
MTHYRVKALAIGLLGSVAALSATPALAANSAADYFRERAETSQVPQILSDADQAHYRDIFAAIALEDWSHVEERLAKREDGLLQQVALAEYYTHASSPKIEAEQIAAWFEMGTHLPQAEQLARLGEKRGLEYTPSLPRTQSFSRQSYASKRLRPRSVQDGTMPEDIRSEILEHIKNDNPDSARLLLDGIDELLSAEARAEWRQRVAW